jgi:hypothetical protein
MLQPKIGECSAMDILRKIGLRASERVVYYAFGARMAKPSPDRRRRRDDRRSRVV